MPSSTKATDWPWIRFTSRGAKPAAVSTGQLRQESRPAIRASRTSEPAVAAIVSAPQAR